MPAEVVISILAVTLLGTAGALWMLPVGTCSECPHCRVERLAREREYDAKVSRIYGIPLCHACGRHHRPEEGHRT
jgi:hypothetical protein